MYGIAPIFAHPNFRLWLFPEVTAGSRGRPLWDDKPNSIPLGGVTKMLE